MKLLFLLAASFVASTASSYQLDKDVSLALDAYSHAANIRPLRDFGDDELRIWSIGSMSGSVVGVVISRGGAIQCHGSYKYAEGTITIGRAKCRPWHKGQAALSLLDPVAALDGKEWDCPVFDGSDIYIDGVRNGRRFSLRVGNPWACSDPQSKAVMDLVDEAW
jgi:hypothetical protein